MVETSSDGGAYTSDRAAWILIASQAGIQAIDLPRDDEDSIAMP
jgi:hypothetical protein